MSEEIFDKVLAVLPLVPDGQFFLSCAFEPTIHPRFGGLLRRIPIEYRKKVCFTTNLAKDLSDELIEGLSRSNLHHVNISLDSLDLNLYESLRRGAKFHVFIDNLEKLTRAFSANPLAPPIRYITVVCKSNIAEAPRILETCATKYLSSENEFRYFWTYDHQDQRWVERNLVTYAEWRDMEEKLSKLPYRYVLAIAPGLSPPDPSRSPSEYERFVSQMQDPRRRTVYTAPVGTPNELAPNMLFIRSDGRVLLCDGSGVEFDLTDISRPGGLFAGLLEVLSLSVERANELRSLVDHRSELQRGLAQCKSTIHRLEASLAERDTELQRLESERARPSGELNNARSSLLHRDEQLQNIRSSFGYKVMRFSASRIDRICPEGTRRGEARKLVVASLRVITEEGVRSYLRYALEKIRRREFRIVKPRGAPQTRTRRTKLGQND
jgi:hypothetical protein